MAKSNKKERKVIIGFSSQILLDTDNEVYRRLNLVLPIQIKTAVGMSEIIKKTTPKDILILDEADSLLFDDLCQNDLDLPLCHCVIGLTATSF